MSYRDYLSDITEFGPCRACGCTPETQCDGGCQRDQKWWRPSLGLCTACMSRKGAEGCYSGTKSHAKRGNSLSEAQIEQFGGRVCHICENGEMLVSGLAAADQQGWRGIQPYRHLWNLSTWVGMICSITNARGRAFDGCSRYLGYVTRGTPYGSIRRLRALAHYRDNRLDLTPYLDTSVTQYDRDEAKRRRKDFDISPAEVAALRAAAGHKCQICNRPEAESVPADRRHRMVIDHDHETHLWRGLLCPECNSSMKFLDYGPLADRERYYSNALQMFSRVDGVRVAPNYDKLRAGNKARAEARRLAS
ncbi:endonuclease domain-containing protein [Nonomuraea sp. NPDC059007]|uniref:endonuclease domain-containing protein n=1 Tax=Nonomuraea sp. NPDC059007 TaxID=3346692 RepID=UPI0036A3EEF9